MTVPVWATSATCSVNGGTGLVYNGTATSDGITVNALSTTTVYYVNSTSTVSNKTNPAPPPPNPYTLVVASDWCINTTNGDFIGNIQYGSYKTQTNVIDAFNVDGRQSFTDVAQTFSGTGTWGTSGSGLPQLTFSYFNTVVNGGGASTQTQTSSVCANGQTSIPVKVCTSFASTSKSWEGLGFVLDFDATKFSFVGALVATDTSGMNLSRNTTLINWNLVGIDPPADVPVPAAAWLFGSGLVGLAGAARRRSKKVESAANLNGPQRPFSRQQGLRFGQGA